MKKGKPKNKRAKKLKELRKSLTNSAPIALTLTKCVEHTFKKIGVENIWESIDSYRVVYKSEWFNRCYIPYERMTDVLQLVLPKNEEIKIDFSDIAEVVEQYNLKMGKNLNVMSCCNGIWETNFTEAKYLLPILAAWRQHKQIFTFDADFLSTLLMDDSKIYSTGVSSIITSSELASLPFPAFYVDAAFDSPKGRCDGFFFCYNTLQGHEGANQLVFYFLKHIPEKENLSKLAHASMLLETVNLQQITFDLHDEETNLSVWECFQKDCSYNNDIEGLPLEKQEQELKNRKDSFALLFKGLQILTYLASQYADVKENPQQKKVYKPATKGIKDTPHEIQKWDVGVRMGSVIRAANLAEVKENTVIGSEKGKEEYIEKISSSKPHTSTPKKPHSRRAHWQYYWYGKRDGSEQRVRRLKFVEATFVNFKESKQLDEIPAVYHPVVSF